MTPLDIEQIARQALDPLAKTLVAESPDTIFEDPYTRENIETVLKVVTEAITERFAAFNLGRAAMLVMAYDLIENATPIPPNQNEQHRSV